MPPPSPAPDRPPSADRQLAPLDLDELAARLADRVAELVTAASAPRPLLTQAEVADWLNVGERTVDNLVALGELPTVRITPSGRSRRFERAAVEAFIRRNARSL